jgi:alpha-tubulin suppressor-like RCC1 family protein/Tfp pilus assembly major pilin PilA
MRKRFTGYTLVETLIVTAVIGILALIILISYSAYLQNTKTAASRSNAQIAQKVAEAYNAENSTYPGTSGRFILGGSGVKVPDGLSIVADADDTTLNDANGLMSIGYACMDSCTAQKIKGGRITYWDFASKSPKYIFLGSANASSAFDFPPVLTSIVSGGNSNCGFTNTGLTYCWGYSGDGQFANNKEGEANATYPTPVYTKGALDGLTIKSVSAGTQGTCAIASNDKLYCWGNGINGEIGDDEYASYNQPVAVHVDGQIGGEAILSISTSTYFSCAISSSHRAFCWGGGWNGQLGNGTTGSYGQPIAIDTTGVLNGKTIKALSTGWDHTCVIASDDKAYCWGANRSGEIGDGTKTQRTSPVAVNTAGALNGKTIKSISAGVSTTCVIASDDNAYCWGQNDIGELGDGTIVEKTLPTAVFKTGALGSRPLKSISTAGWHTCVIASDDNGYCWGSNWAGELGDNTYNASSNVPVAVYTGGKLSGKTLSVLSVGVYHTCAVTTDSIAYCWGSNARSATAQTLSREEVIAPEPISTSGAIKRLSVKSISAGGLASCIIASDNNAYCWGKNDVGQLGNNMTSNRLVPSKSVTGALANKTLKTLSLRDQVCATDSSDIPYCWGESEQGKTGTGDFMDVFSPKLVDRTGVLNGKTIKKTAAGGAHTCAIASDDKAYCWGDDYNGNLGAGTNSSSTVPVAVSTAGVLNGKTIKDITAGEAHTCVIASDDKAYCWGYNGYGQLGDNTFVGKNIPVAVNTAGVLNGKTIKSISAGWEQTCAIASDDKAYCWGQNLAGGLGNNSLVDSSIPVAVNTAGVLAGKTIKALATGNYHTCVIASDDKAYCWGANWRYELGNGTDTNSSVPVAVYTNGILKGRSVKTISSGGDHSCAITTLNEFTCWGSNDNGQLGNNSRVNSSMPVWVIM